jgi:IS1 family transposase
MLGNRDGHTARRFVSDLASRLSHRVQITTDSHRPYLQAVEDAFGGDVDYAMLHKVYGFPMEHETRYSPATCIGCEQKRISGDPAMEHISTSFVERQNWTVRTNMRRYTRLSNGFSRKIGNHAAAVALNYFSYNFIKIHRTLRVSPAMAAGVTDHQWEVKDLVALGNSTNRRGKRLNFLNLLSYYKSKHL